MLQPEEERATGRCYSFSKDMYRWVVLPEMAANKGKRIYSSKGWLLLVLSAERSLWLYNPLSGARIQLPDNSSLGSNDDTGFLDYPFFVDKFCLSCCPTSNPDDDDFQVMILSRKLPTLAIWRSGDSFWTYVKTSRVVSCRFVNVTYCGGEFVAITYDGKIVGCDAGSIDTWRKKKKNSLENAEDMVKVRLIADLNPLLRKNRTESPHLVAIDDKLLIAARRLEKILSSSKTDLYMLIEVDVGNGKATEVNDSRNRSIFLGEHNEAFSVEATSRYRFRPNCIYFAHHVKGPEALDKAMCIYNLVDGVYEHHHKSESFGSNGLLWIQPRL